MTNEEARVELVVKIDEGTYKDIKKGKVYTSFRDVPQEAVLAIANGTPLPKGHGRLIDADALPLNAIDDANHGSNYIRIAHTIIEADTPKRRKGTPLEENDSGYNCENWIP